MMRAGNFITEFSNTLLENKQRAIMYAAILSIVPFASWLSITLVMLITLRKGAKPGFEVMLPAFIMHAVPLIVVMSLKSALINTLAAYLPCYIAALVLRKTTNWQMVFGVFFIQALVGFVVVQLWAPDFIVNQFNHFKSLLIHYKEYQLLVNTNTDGLTTFILAQLFFGAQIVSVIVSAVISLSFARSIQSKLFLPGEFRKEVLGFRCGRLSFLILMAVSIASYYEIPLALNVLPSIVCYFLLSGFSLSYYVLARKNQFKMTLLLVLLVFFKPSLILLAYVLLGSLDSLFNFRVYLPERVREST